jgi:hypothetical protein
MKILVGILLILASLINIAKSIYDIWYQFFEYGELYYYWALWNPFYYFVLFLVGLVLVFDKKGN